MLLSFRLDTIKEVEEFGVGGTAEHRIFYGLGSVSVLLAHDDGVTYGKRPKTIFSHSAQNDCRFLYLALYISVNFPH